ncbi:Zn-ribbon domain-containing OB-fold protein [Actinophytocola sediminis]
MPTIGIDSVSAYTPGYRLNQGLAAELAVPPDRPLAAPDEDGLTLAWEALRHLTPTESADGSTDESTVDSPLVLRVPAGDLEPRALAAHLATAGPFRTPRTVLPLSRRTGATSTVVAAAGLGAGAVAVLADHGRPAGPVAPPSQDGAVALRLGEPRAAEVLAAETLPVLAYDRWRDTEETGPPDPRFVEETLLAIDGGELLDRLVKRAGITRGDLAGVVLSACVPVRAARWATRWQVPAVWTAGPEYAAGRLAAATLRTAFEHLADAGQGALVAVLELGWGGDGLLLRAGEDIAAVSLGATAANDEYGYRLWSSTLSTSDSAMWTSAAKLRREAPALVGLGGTRCESCADVAFPPRFVCDQCGGADLRPVPLARTGTVLSHNLDRLFAAPDRDVQMVVVDLDGGGRFFGQLAAGAPHWAAVDDRVHLVLRRLHDGGDLPHYFWKAELA